MAEDSAVKVCVRVRPLIDREDAACENAPTLHWKADHNCVHQVDDGATVKSFSFDRVFTVHETTKQLYQAIAKPLVVSTVQGYNGTIFAYGQTSSGKTFTMMGSDQTPGVIPLAVEDVFQTIQNCPDEKEFLLRVSYMEIYNETVTDLLVESWRRKPLEVRESLNKNIYVADLSEELVTSTAQALHWIRVGEKNRHYGKTKMNQRSSRSHTIFRMILESRETSDSETSDGAIIVSHLNLVDLAGSERASQTGAEGARFKEGCNINRSLFTLGQVIKKLTEESQTGFINYRDSKLTRILQNSLGGNAKTVIICTITPETLDETMSSLQFASTAKKMKNDPHVTEVSDDGALLKRYRNEIVDLKRRLLEVSSVTQTTATEKELLSQTLQEKDQLQREQEDRIRNLTNLLVSTNSIIPAARPAPKRRVTWGGQMLKLVSGSSAASELNLTEVSSKKRKTTVSDRDLGESFHHWEIPEEAPEDMDDSHVTTRSFGDSPKDVPPERLSSLEQQLESERLQSSEAQATVKALNERLAELELQLQEELQLKEDARRREAELELQAQMEKERLKEPAENVDQIKRQFSEAVQLCEALASEKDSLLSERNYLKDELGLSLEQIRTLEKENADLSHGLEEKREIDEFENLEQQIIHDNEEELREEISRLKIALQSSERKCQDVQNDFDALSVELKKKCDLIERLQQMNGKDLVEEVSTLQRSLGDAEKVSLDTKKEWACLRSQTMALEERTVMLTLHSEKSENEATSLRCQLEREKSKYKKMQFDLQKELNVTFEENVKLGALLDGKVPKNLIDNVELERSLTKLNKDLASCHEANAELQLKLEQELQAKEQHLQELQAKEQHLQELQAKEQHLQELQAKEQHLQELQAKEQHLQELQVKVAELVKQLEESECLRVSLTEQLHEIHQLKADLEEKITDGETARRTDEDIQKELEEQLEQLTAELQSVQAQKEAAMSECERLRSVCSDRDVLHQLKEERDQLKEERDQLKEERDQLKEERDQLKEERDQLKEERDQLKEERDQLKEERDQLKEERDQLKEERDQLKEERDQLKEERDQLKEERDQLKEERDQLKEERDQLKEERDQLKGERDQLKEERDQLKGERDQLKGERDQLKEERDQLKEERDQLKEERDQLKGERDQLKEERDQLKEERDQLKEERDQLKEERDQLKEERDQLKEERDQLKEERDQLKEERDQLKEERDQLKGERDQLKGERDQLKGERDQLKGERDQLKGERDQLKGERDQLKEDLQENIEMMIDIQDELRALQEKNVEQKENIQKLKASSTQEEASAEQERLQAQMTSLEEQLQRAGADGKRSKEELDELVSRVSALTEDKEQLQQLLDNTSGLASLQSELNQAETQENMAKLQQELDEAQRKVQSLEQMLQEKNQKNLDLERLSQERLDELERRTAELQRAGADGGTSKEELDELVSRVSALTENKEQLQQLLDTLKEEKQQLGGQMTDLTETVQSLTETVQSLTEQKNRLKQLHHDMEEELEMLKKESEAQQVLQQSLNEAKQTICDLREEMSLLPDEQLLKESTLQLQEEFKELKAFWEECRDWDSERGNYRLLSAPPGLDSLPKNTVQSVNAVNDLCWQTIGRISLMFVQQHKFFQSFHQLWEDLVKKDVSVFEERRLQDVLTCRATASSFNIKHLDFVPLWKLRMKELLEKRRCYIQKMEQTRTRMRASFKREFSTELKEKKSYENRLQEICASEPLDVSALDSFLDAQQLLRNTLLQERNRFFEALSEEHTELLKELTQAAAQAQTLLEEEKNKRFILERAVDDSTLKTEATIIMDNRMLQDQLTAAQYQLRVALDQRRAAQDQLTAAQDQLTAAQDQLTAAQDQLTAAQEELEVVSLEKQQLQKVQVQAERRVSAHKEATQLLQTELQDALAKLHEMERREASEAKRNASAELQQLKRTVSELELELQTSSEKHQHELQRLTSLLDVKTTSLRRLKETLRSEQDDPPYLEGEALAARLVQPKGVIQTRTLLDKSKRDEEIKRLKLRITELESLVSSLHADVAKWKQRALKMKSAEVRPLCTPPKRQRLDSPRLRSPMKPLDSPRLRSPMKPLDSPRLRSPMKPLNSPSLLNLPKSGFFGGGSSSEVLERNCPKQFFDNSGLGAARGEGEEADWPQWPLSPNQQKMCNKQ